MDKKKRICLALQGGGAYGAYTWGILDKFLEDGRLEIDGISATSSGSLNAVILAQALSKGNNQEARDSLLDLWRSISILGEHYSPIRDNLLDAMLGINITSQYTFILYDALTKVFSPYILNPLNFNPLRELLSKKIDFEQLRKNNKFNLYLCATNVRTGHIKIFDNSAVSVDTLMASACLPDLYQAVEIEGEHYWDGGFIGNPAIFPLIYNSNIDDIIIIQTNPIIRNTVPLYSSEIENRINEISFNASLLRELRAIAFISKLIDEGYIKDEYKDKIKRKLVHIIRSDSVMNQFTLIDKYRWNWSFLINLRDLGRIVAQNWLDANFSSIGKKSTINFDDFS